MKKSLWVVLILAFVCVFALSACGDTNQPQAPTEDHVHAFGEWTTVKDASCTADGIQERSCSCGEKETNSINATGHTEVVDAAVAATCTMDGKTEGKHCSVCNETLIAQNNIPASHTDGEWVIDTNATCTEDGSKHQVCSVCNESIKTETIAAIGHTDGEWVTDTDATCTVEGSKHQECAVCSAAVKTEKIAATGHTDGAWITDADATCTIDGSKHQVCSVCNATIKTKTIAATGHTDGEWVTDTAATCTEDGSKHQVCSVCNATIKTEIVTKLGHNDGQWITDKEASCTEDGSKHLVCSICEETIKTQTVAKLGHNYKENLPEKVCVDKDIIYQCQNCGDTYKNQLQPISANIIYGYWSYIDSACYVQDVLSFDGIEGGYGKYTITITYVDPRCESHVYTYTSVDDLYITKYLGGASWASSFRQVYPPRVTIEIEDELGLKTTYKADFPTLDASYYDSGYNMYSQDVSANVSTETPHNYSTQYIAPTKNSSGYTAFICSDCGHSKNEQWENISIDLNYVSGGYGMYRLTIKNVSGGAIKYQDGIRVKNNYAISIVNIAVGYVEKSGYINEETGTFGTDSYVVSTYCKYNIIVSDGYSTYVFSTDYIHQYPVLRNHIVPQDDNIIRFSVSYDRHDSYDLYRLRIDAIYGGNTRDGVDNSYTIAVKSLSDNSVKTYTDVKEFSGIVVGSSYSSYSNQRYEITISDGTYTYTYTTSIGSPTPQLKT